MGKNHYNILFSIPVHEKPEVVLDLVTNIQHFNPDCCIVLHISQSFDYDSDYLSEEEFLKILNGIDSVIINPNRLRSGLEDIIQCHISNFRYAYKNVDFDYVIFTASNELFFSFGLWNDIKAYDCGPAPQVVIESNTDWNQGKHALEDIQFIEAMNSRSVSKIYGGQFEGLFMKSDMMLHISDIIDSFYDYRNMNVKYAREEIFFHTLIAALYPDAHFRDKNTTYMNWSNDLRISVADVINLVHNNEDKYSLKRVPRFINDEVRTFIRDYIGCYEKNLDRFFLNKENVQSDSSLMLLNKKNELKCNIYRRWLTVKQNALGISDYLVSQKITIVTIYGYGEVGKILYKELLTCNNIQIEYIIDKRNVDNTGEVKVVEPYPKLSTSQLIIVTVLDDESLLDQLKTRYQIPCIEIAELLKNVSEII